jgi:hypothetical protein
MIAGQTFPAPLTYAQIMNDVRNMRVLTSQQMIFVRTLPKDKVLELLEIYNQIMANVNEIMCE